MPEWKVSTIDQAMRPECSVRLRRIGCDGKPQALGSILVLALHRGTVGDRSLDPRHFVKPFWGMATIRDKLGHLRF